MANHLDFDTDFLNNTPEKKADTQSQGGIPPKKDGGYKGWIIAAVVIGVLFIIGSMDSSSTSSSPTTTTNTPSTYNSGNSDSDLVATGQYMCTQYHNTKATQLEPTNESSLELERSALGRKSDAIDSLRSEIENSAVTEYSSQSDIDEYNQMIENHDNQIAQYKIDSDRFQAKIDKYNSDVEIYNNYLTTNCRPK